MQFLFLEAIMSSNIDFVDSIKNFANTVQQRKATCLTEEATKMSLIVPLFQLLGYDVFNPTEFCPEYIADVGIKKGEKVDYAILINGDPHILIECKACTETLDSYATQLYRYFGTSKAKYGILTNGVIYRFYTDLEENNKMDMVPFLEVDMLNLKDNAIINLKKFTKESYDKDAIFSTAEELKYSKMIKDKLQSLMDNPDDDFTKLILGYVYTGTKTQRIIDKYRPLIKKSFNSFVSETVNARINSALNEVKGREESSDSDEAEEAAEESKIFTTVDELEAFYIVRAILAEKVPVSDIEYKDTESYFSIIYQGKTKKPICRLQLDRKKKYIMIPDESKDFQRFPIDSLADLYSYKKQLISVLSRYL